MPHESQTCEAEPPDLSSRQRDSRKVAAYRQTVLAAFQQVEDPLAAVRILSKQIQQREEAVQSAQQFLKLSQARYETGVDTYLEASN